MIDVAGLFNVEKSFATQDMTQVLNLETTLAKVNILSNLWSNLTNQIVNKQFLIHS